MIEEFKNVGTHAEQIAEGLINALVKAGIGRAYAAKTLDDAGDQGTAMKRWMIDNRERLMSGYGFDFRGQGTKSVNLVNLVGRGLIHMGIFIQIVPLVRLPKLLADDEEAAHLRAVKHLIIRDFETTHENPLRPYETASVEAMIEDRAADAIATSVVRRGAPKGWWSATTEDVIETTCRVVEIA